MKILFQTLILIVLAFEFSLAAEIKSPEKVKTISFELIDNRIFVNAYLNDEGPFKFIFDTGGSNSITPDLAKKLKLNVIHKGQATGAGSGSQDMGETKIKKVLLAEGIELFNQDFLVMDYSKIQKAFELPALDGILGFEFLQANLVYIDFENSKISFFSDSKEFDFSNFEKINFELKFDKPFIETKINGLNAKTLIDTGDRSALTITKSFRQNKIDNLFQGKPDVITGFGIGGPIFAQLDKLSKVQLNTHIKWSDVAARAPTSKGGFNAVKDLDASIGNQVLKQLNIVFDYRDHFVYVKKNKNFGDKTKFVKVPKINP